ncbi:MAG: HIT family protein [Thermoproteota archaeon]|jgi:histidine triad (HIT) family protein|nr:HIT family protein [Thermoproteota archaeon]MEC9074276.1 HIT family protein [Thermoproteota archaeon]MED5276018.1 HIT family protein [Thermoproteota archaeon]MED5283219.1 HIT family protein [Thermoproteota archaeon]MED5543198.1 HIT family protein [Thermoproteota archaeon]|tara:strand:+ start:107 stop:517 length:411 start_codon:yes stop_codon:yes gene_type:complete
MDCIFCKIVSKEIPTKILYEDEYTIAFLDAFPVAKGHTLVIPKQHYAKIQDLPSEINEKLFNTVHKLIPKVDSLQGSTLVAIHNGKDSGQEIPHVHVHLIPRSKNDSAGPVHSMFKDKIELSDSETDSLYDQLKIV